MSAWRSTLTLVAVVAVLAAGCAPGPGSQSSAVSPQASTGPQRLVTAIKGDPPTLSDKINSSGAGGVPGVSEVERLIAGGLTVRDDRGTLRPQLAQSVPTVENGLWRLLPDGRMDTTWTIVADARWHDGTQLTADDLVFTAQLSRDRELPQLRDTTLDALESVEVVDPYTVVAHWRQPYIDADSLFGAGKALPLPQHLLGPTYAENKAALVEQPYWTRDFVGLGPYRVREWVAGSHLVLTANEDYVLGRPKIDELEVRFIPDPNTLAANILASVVDLTLGRGLDLEQADVIRAQRRDATVDLAIAGCLCAFPQYLNPSPAAVADLRFRRALSHATDRRAYAESLQNGQVPEAHIFVGPNQAEYPFIESSVSKFEYDPRATGQILEGMGYTRAADGFYYDPSQQRLSVEMRTTPGEEVGKKLLFAVADSWQRAGVAVEPIVIPPQQATDREWRANFPGLDMVNQPSTLNLLQRFNGKEASLPTNDYRGNNRMRYQNAELDTYIDGYFVTIPWTERMQVAAQAIGHITENVVAMSLLYNAMPVIMSTRIQHVASTNVGWNAHEWELR